MKNVFNFLFPFCFSVFLIVAPNISWGEKNSDSAGQSVSGDFTLACQGEIVKIEELHRMRITAKGCVEISFIIEGKDTVTGRVFFPSSKSFVGGKTTEETTLNDKSLQLTVTRSAAWNDDYSDLKMITITEAVNSAGAKVASKKILMDLVRGPNGAMSLSVQNNDTANVPDSKFQNALCTLNQKH